MYKLIWQIPVHFLSAQMAVLSRFLQMFIVLGVYNFACRLSMHHPPKSSIFVNSCHDLTYENGFQPTWQTHLIPLTERKCVVIHPFYLHPEKWFEGYPVKSTQISITANVYRGLQGLCREIGGGNFKITGIAGMHAISVILKFHTLDFHVKIAGNLLVQGFYGGSPHQ